MGDTIIGVQFGIANPADIVKRSVVEVITDKTYQGNQPVPGGVFDSRFGVIENGKVCPTCKQTNILCPGHFGHITFLYASRHSTSIGCEGNGSFYKFT
jgi:DNA-directed RNA polymerase beta' subunit